MDDFLLGATVPGMEGRGCGKQAVIVAVERGTTSAPGGMAMRAVPDCGGGAYAAFAEARIHVLSHVMTDDWNGIRGGLAGWPGLDQGPFDPSDPARSLPTVHHAISNFRAYVQGTFHGVSRTRLQGVMDEFCWRYSQRGSRGIATALMRDCLGGYRTVAELLGSFGEQPYAPRFKAGSRLGREHRERVDAMVAAARTA